MQHAPTRRSAMRSIVALTVLGIAAASLPGCSSGRVSIDVDGVDARWMAVPGPGQRQVLVVTGSEDQKRPGRRSRPLFVVLHGAGQDAEAMTTYGGWAVAARDEHAVAAFAEGINHTFDAGTCCGTSAARHVDDVGYIDRLITTVSRRVGADPSKVYMVGFSNGAMMVYRYLCEGAVRPRGAVSLAGTNAAGCTPRPTTFLQVSGTSDNVVPIDDTPSAAPQLGPLVPVNHAVGDLAAAWSCPRPRRDVVGTVATTTWSPCAEGVTLRYDVVAGLLHTYPVSGSYSATTAALEMWGFG